MMCVSEEMVALYVNTRPVIIHFPNTSHGKEEKVAVNHQELL